MDHVPIEVAKVVDFWRGFEVGPPKSASAIRKATGAWSSALVALAGALCLVALAGVVTLSLDRVSSSGRYAFPPTVIFVIAVALAGRLWRQPRAARWTAVAAALLVQGWFLAPTGSCTERLIWLSPVGMALVCVAGFQDAGGSGSDQVKSAARAAKKSAQSGWRMLHSVAQRFKPCQEVLVAQIKQNPRGLTFQ